MISLCDLGGPLCLSGEITRKNIHHRGTEISQRTTERIEQRHSTPFCSTRHCSNFSSTDCQVSSERAAAANVAARRRSLELLDAFGPEECFQGCQLECLHGCC